MGIVIEGIPQVLKGILLDFDGTLIELIPKWWKPLENAFVTVKGVVPENTLRANLHHIMQDIPIKPSKMFLLRIIWTIGREGGLTRIETMRFVKHARANFQHTRYINILNPGVQEYLLDWKANNIKLCIVTTAGYKEMNRAIDELEILKDIPIVAREDVENLKPHPEPIIKALTKIGLKPDETIFVGDFVSDIEAGKNAGTYTVGLMGQVPEISKSNLEKSNPDLLVQYLSDLKYSYSDN